MTGMNCKTYKIWCMLLSAPNEWQSITSMAYDMNMTSRQVSSIVGMMPSPPVVKERDENDNKLYVRLEGTHEEITRMKAQVISDYFGIPPETWIRVQHSLSPVGWMSVSDISDDTGVEKLRVSRILAALPNVVSKGSGTVTLYRLGGY